MRHERHKHRDQKCGGGAKGQTRNQPHNKKFAAFESENEYAFGNHYLKQKRQQRIEVMREREVEIHSKRPPPVKISMSASTNALRLGWLIFST